MWKLPWQEYNELAGKSVGKVRGNLFYCYWLTLRPCWAVVTAVAGYNNIVPLEWELASVLFTAVSLLSCTECAQEKMPNMFVWLNYSKTTWLECLLCASLGAELCISTPLDPCLKNREAGSLSYGKRVLEMVLSFRYSLHKMDLLCEKRALTINEFESFCQCQFQEKTVSQGHVDAWSIWAEERG